MIFVGLIKAEAASNITCYYISNELAARVEVYGKIKFGMNTYLDRRSLNMVKRYKKQPVENLTSDKKVVMRAQRGNEYIPGAEYTVPKYDASLSCPEYIIFYDSGDTFSAYYTYAAQTEQVGIEMKNARDTVPKPNKVHVYYAKNDPTLTEETYFKRYMDVFSYNGELLNGNKICDLDTPGCTSASICTELLGDVDNPETIHYLLNEILTYVRIIVPILIILLGTFDLAKAMLAGKDDEIKKAQKHFVRRIIAGVAVFFVPALINVIIGLADMIWDYTTCTL